MFKLTRPVDPISQLPASFALVTYSQALCAVRCYRTLNGFVVNTVDDVRLEVKVIPHEPHMHLSVLYLILTLMFVILFILFYYIDGD